MSRISHSVLVSGVLVAVGTSMSSCQPQATDPGAQIDQSDSPSILAPTQPQAGTLLSGGVVLTLLDSDMTLTADSLRIREGAPWEAIDVTVTVADKTIRADYGLFDPDELTYRVEGGVVFSQEPETN